MDVIKKHDYCDVVAYELGFAPVGRPAMNTIFYLVDGILIDTGQRHMQKAFINIIKDAKIEQVVLTHHHEDHSGNASTVKKIKRAPVFGHDITIKKLESGFNILPYQIVVWGRAEPLDIDPFPAQIESDRLRLFPVHTPGHSKDHTVFFDKENGRLFSGDLYLGSHIKYFRADEKMDDTIRSIEKVLTLDFDALLCAHRPKPAQGKMYLGQKLEFLKNFSGEVSHLYQKGHDIKSIMSAMDLKEVRWMKFLTNGNVSLENMIKSILNGC